MTGAGTCQRPPNPGTARASHFRTNYMIVMAFFIDPGLGSLSIPVQDMRRFVADVRISPSK